MMPLPLLGATDSFNSSGATIVPDKRRSGSSSSQHTRFYPGQDHFSLRALGGTTSFEGHINTALRVGGEGDDGMIGILQNQTETMGGNGLSGLSFMREYMQLPDGESQEQPSSQPHGVTQNAPYSSSPSYQGPNIPVSSAYNPAEYTGHAPVISPFPTGNHTIGSDFRPSSSLSHHSAASSNLDHSEYYSTTDIDTDDEIASIHDGPGLAVPSGVGDLGLGDIDLAGAPAVMTWTPYRAAGLHMADVHDQNGVSPASITSSSVSPRELTALSPSAVSTTSGRGGRAASVAGSKKGRRGSVRGVGRSEEVPGVDRLEHRRDINRRSAQKHRARRKEEIELMSRALAERDAKIARLERDLQVEKGRNEQLRNMMNARLASSSGFP
ncbi:hypothetical protein IAU60_000556 [Kwoniella sp. DSM 27419]